MKHTWSFNQCIDFYNSSFIDKGSFRIRKQAWHTSATKYACSNSKPIRNHYSILKYVFNKILIISHSHSASIFNGNEFLYLIGKTNHQSETNKLLMLLISGAGMKQNTDRRWPRNKHPELQLKAKFPHSPTSLCIMAKTVQ